MSPPEQNSLSKTKQFWIARLLIIKKESMESSTGKTMGFREVDFRQLRAAVLASCSE